MVEIEILNWDAFNKKRSDVKNPGWMRLELTFPQSQSLFGLTATERYVFLSLLCLAGQKQSAVHRIDPPWFCHWAGGCFSEAEFLAAVERLASKQEPAIRVRNVHVTCAERTRNEHVTGTGVTNERTNERTDDDESETREPPEPLPTELDTPEIREVCNRRQLKQSALRLWLTKAPSPQWLADKLQELDLEADANFAYGQKPFVVRVREYLTRHLEYEKTSRDRERQSEAKAQQEAALLRLLSNEQSGAAL